MVILVTLFFFTSFVFYKSPAYFYFSIPLFLIIAFLFKENKLFLKTMIMLFLICIIFGVVIHFRNLGSEFWGDELNQIRIADSSQNLRKVIQLNATDNFDPPLFSTLLFLWQKVSPKMFSLRLFPVLISLIGAVYFYKLLDKFTKSRLIRLSIMSLYFCSWVFIHYAEEVRAYSLAMTTTILLFYSFYDFYKKPTGRNLVRLTVITILSLFVQYSIWLYLPAIFNVVVVNAVKLKKRQWFKYFFTITFLTSLLLILTQLRYQLGGFGASYLDNYKLSNFALQEIPVKLIEYNSQFAGYVLGIQPWYINEVGFFPAITSVVGIIFYSTIIIIIIESIKVIFYSQYKVNPLVGLFFYVLVVTNLLSLLGLYPVGPVRMSLFYSVLLLIYLANLLNVIKEKNKTVFYFLILIILFIVSNNIYRFVRIPQKHMGNEIHYFYFDV
jgi:hypothetical protein